MSSKKMKRKVKPMEEAKTEKGPSKVDREAAAELVYDDLSALFEAEQRAQVKKACALAFQQWLAGAAELSEESIIASIPERTIEHIVTLVKAENEYTNKRTVAKREVTQVMREIGIPTKKPQAQHGTDYVPPWLRKKEPESKPSK